MMQLSRLYRTLLCVSILTLTSTVMWAQGTLSDSLVLRNTGNGRTSLIPDPAMLPAANWRLQLPGTSGATGSVLYGTLVGNVTSLSWLAPGSNGDILTLSGGLPSWQNLNATAWLLVGNPTTTAWNGAAGSFLGTTTTQPLSIATTNATAQAINFYTGAAGANLRMTIAGNGNINLNGTAGTPNVSLTSVSGVANATIPVGYDRVLVSNATGDVSQTTYEAVANATSWTLLGNAGTLPATNFLGTTDAQPLVIRTNNTEKVRVLSTGEVGIGTPTPNAGSLLHVFGVAGTANVRLTSISGVAAAAIPVGYDRLVLANTNGDLLQANFATVAAQSSWALLGNAGIGAANFLGSTNSAFLAFRTNNVERMRINATAAEVGIGGTAVARRALHVFGTAGTSNVRLASVGGAAPRAAPLAGYDRILLSNTNGDVDQVASTTFAWLLDGNVTTSAWNGAVGSYLGTSTALGLSLATTNATAQPINFYTGAAGANLRMTIAGNGNITLNGTAGTPNVTLTSVSGVANAGIPVGYDRVLVSNVTGNVNQTTYSAIVSQNAWTLTGNSGTIPLTNFLGTTDAQPLVIRTNNVEQARFNATGELGLGITAAAGVRLQVAGTAGTPNVRLGSVGGAAKGAVPVGFDRFLISNLAGDLDQVSYNALLQGTAWLLDGNPTTTSWNGAAGSFLGTTSTQPLAIATTNATAQDINFYTGAAGANLRMTIGSAGAITLNGTAGTPNVTLTSIGGVANAAVPVGYDRFMLSNVTGDVSQASFNAVLASTAWLLAGNGTTTAWNGAAGSFLGTTSAQPLSIATTNATAQDINFYTGAAGANLRMTIGSTGNITLNGTVGTPNVALTSISGAANATIPVGYDRLMVSNATGDVSQTTFAAAANATSWTLLGNTGTVPATNFLGTIDAQPLVIRTTNLERLRVNATGELGIGTTAAAGYLLHVNGTAGTPNVRLTSVSGVAGATIPAGFDRVLVSNATGDVDQASYSAVVASTAWVLTGNPTTTSWNGVAGSFLGTTTTQDLVLNTNSVFRARLVGGAVNTGNLVLGTTTASPTNSTAASAVDRLTILGGDLSLNSESNIGITRQILFRGTAGSGNFRIGADGGDFYWQGGGARNLQMGSYWGIQLSGQRQVGAFPAFTNGVGTTPHVDVILAQNTVPGLVITPTAAFTANQQEWRNSAGTALSSVTAAGNIGIGVTTGITAKLQINSASTTGNAIQLDPYGAAAGNTGQIRFRELAANGNEYVSLQSPDALANVNAYTLPNATGTAGQVLGIAAAPAPTATAATLTWVTVPTTPTPYEEATSGIRNIRRISSLVAGPAAVPALNATDLQSVRTLATQTASANQAFIGGGSDNTSAGANSGILSGNGNIVLSSEAAIAGGLTNTIQATSIGSFIGSGTLNQVGSNYSSVVGGSGNIINAAGLYAVIGGGASNITNANYTGILGGSSNLVTGDYSSVVGGSTNIVNGSYSTILGGQLLTLAATGQVGFNAGTSAMVVTAPGTAVFANANLWLANNNTTASELRFYEPNLTINNFPAIGTNYVAFKAPVIPTLNDQTYTLPDAVGTANQVLTIASVPAPTATTATLQWSPITVTPGVVTVNILIDDQLVPVLSTTTFLRLVGNALPAARTVLLTNGLLDGQQLVIRCVAVGADGVQFLDAGNLALSGNFNLNNSDTITLIWDAATGEWLEVARRNN